MTVQFFDEGIVRERDRLLGVVAAPTLEVMLFTAPTSLNSALTYSSFTELTAVLLPGYARFSLTAGTWVLSLTASVATGVYPTLTWTFTANAGTTTIYGYLVVDTTGTQVAMWGELFGPGLLVPSVGMNLNLNITYNHEQCP